MDNCESIPYKNLSEENFLFLIEYIDLCYRGFDFYSDDAIDKCVKLLSDNKVFHKWLISFVFNQSYRLYKGKAYEKHEYKDMPRVGDVIDENNKNFTIWTSSWNVAFKYSSFNKRESNPSNLSGGIICNYLYKQVDSNEVVNDMVNLFNFFYNPEKFDPKLKSDFEKIIKTHKFGQKFNSVVNRLSRARHKINSEKEIVTFGHIGIYDVDAKWEVDKETKSIKVTGDWGQ